MEQFNDQQKKALSLVKEWLSDKAGPQVFRLFGYAGTGKTTLAKHLASEVRGSVVFAALTGKAALVLREKGCDGACTIHSLIYKPLQDQETGQVTFELNADSPVGYAALVIIDEVSMVGEELALDLLSFGTKILVLGDPFQLPPVSGEGYFINATPDYMLTDIRRTEQDNPIIQMSMAIRQGRGLAPGEYGQSRVLSRSQVSKEAMTELVLSADQVLCGLNKTRVLYNQRIREIKGLVASNERQLLPVPGDRLICLRNDKELNIFNGGMWDAEAVSQGKGRAIALRVNSADEAREPLDVETLPEFFTGKDKDLNWRERGTCEHFTYGWAITCHKSQGSQWPHVLVFDESRAFRDDSAKWLYTAITRASEKVVVVI